VDGCDVQRRDVFAQEGSRRPSDGYMLNRDKAPHEASTIASPLAMRSEIE
jgi:hypothetical protein